MTTGSGCSSSTVQFGKTVQFDSSSTVQFSETVQFDSSSTVQFSETVQFDSGDPRITPDCDDGRADPRVTPSVTTGGVEVIPASHLV
jgi:hypothetical protein